uniref:B30.2/SPRY domain-containing protein n=1 Tax=Neogobius melanostomus TaxID=47308 RepID=A0A8C6SK48_9GOBI
MVSHAARALSELETSLSQKFNNKKELRRVQTFAVDVTLDPDTAQPWLDLSEDLKQVHHTGVKKKLPDSPQRFDTGRFYFEVQVKGKTMWTLGVAQESVNRKGKITVSPKNGFWTIWLRDKDKYSANAGPPVLLSPLRPPQKVGVFVDYGAGLVSFYDVDSINKLLENVASVLLVILWRGQSTLTNTFINHLKTNMDIEYYRLFTTTHAI